MASVYYFLETQDATSRIICRSFPYDANNLNWQNTANENGPLLIGGYAEIVTRTTTAGFTTMTTPSSATRFGATTTATSTIGTTTTSIGTKPAGYDPRILMLRIPASNVAKYAKLPAEALFVTILPPPSGTSDSTEIHVHDLYQGDSLLKVTYRSKVYE